MLLKSKDPFLALLAFRSIPLSWCQLSPAELSMGRLLQSNLPQIVDQLITCRNIEEVMLNSRKDKRRTLIIIIEPSHYPLSLMMVLFCLTQMERIKKPGWIVSQMTMPRSYIFQTDTGQFWRNRCHLNQVSTSSQITHNPQPESNQIITQTRTGTAIQPPERLSDSYQKGRCGITPNVTMTLMFVYLVLIYQTLIKC